MRLIKAVSVLSGPGTMVAPTSYEVAARAYRLGMAGMYTRAARTLQRALSELEQDPAATVFRARATGLFGRVSRAAGDLSTAGRHLQEAAELAAGQRMYDEVAASLALRVEAMCAAGDLVGARSVFEAWNARAHGGPAGQTDLANAYLQLAAGNYQEALQLGQAVLRGAQGELQTWAELLINETRLDLSRPLEAEDALAAVVNRLHAQGDFDEAYVRAHVLWARLRVDLFAVGGADAGAAPLEAARSAIRRAQRYAINLPRYRALTLGIRAQFGVLVGEAKAEAKFQEALTLLEGAGTPLDQGRLIARWVALQYALVHKPTRPLVARGRDLFSRAGAHARSQALAQSEVGGGEQGMSMMLSRSLMGQSVAGVMLGEDDLELKAVFEVNRAISSELDVDRLFQRILDEVVKVLKAERGALIRRFPDGSLKCIAGRRIDPDSVHEGGDELSFSVLREVERSGEVVLTDNAQTDERFRGRASVLAHNVRSLMCAPLKSQTGLQGFLYLDSTTRAKVFKETHRELLAIFSTQAAVALENALAFSQIEELNRTLEQKVASRTSDLAETNVALEKSLSDLKNTQLRLLEAEKAVLTREMTVARRIQESIVPGHERLQRPGVAILGRLESATQVGGDFWTWLPLPGDKTFLFIGDVTGHGVGSGMVTVVAKACGDTLLRRMGELDVRDYLETLSDVLHDTTRGDFVMTGFACIVDPALRQISFSSAGHPPPWFIERAGGLPKMVPLSSIQRILGDTRGNQYEVGVRSYSAGDRLVLYTDGLVECTNSEGTAFSKRHFRKQLLQGAVLPLQQQLDDLVNDYHSFFGEHPREDDITVVIAELE